MEQEKSRAMTVEDFKQKYPHLAHLEGDALWNAMEDSILQNANWDPNEPIELSEEDEIEYQKAKYRHEVEGIEMAGMVFKDSNYTRKLWLAFDKPQPVSDKPLSTAKFIIFDVSNNDDPPPLTC